MKTSIHLLIDSVDCNSISLSIDRFFGTNFSEENKSWLKKVEYSSWLPITSQTKVEEIGKLIKNRDFNQTEEDQQIFFIVCIGKNASQKVLSSELIRTLKHCVIFPFDRFSFLKNNFIKETLAFQLIR